jgi:hypothetical protein
MLQVEKSRIQEFKKPKKDKSLAANFDLAAPDYGTPSGHIG